MNVVVLQGVLSGIRRRGCCRRATAVIEYEVRVRLDERQPRDRARRVARAAAGAVALAAGTRSW